MQRLFAKRWMLFLLPWGALTAIIVWTVSGRAGQIAQTLRWVAFLAFAIAEEIFRRKTGERE